MARKVNRQKPAPLKSKPAEPDPAETRSRCSGVNWNDVSWNGVPPASSGVQRLLSPSGTRSEIAEDETSEQSLETRSSETAQEAEQYQDDVEEEDDPRPLLLQILMDAIHPWWQKRIRWGDSKVVMLRRDLVFVLVLLVMLVGTLYNLSGLLYNLAGFFFGFVKCIFSGVSYLLGLNFVRGVGACNVSTVYVSVPGPTVTVPLIEASPQYNASSAALPVGTTVTSFFTCTDLITVTSPAAAVSAGSAPGIYYFSLVNGSTNWLNGLSPTATGGQLATGTTAILVYPSVATTQVATITVTETVSGGATAVTTSSSASEDLTTTLHLTSFITLQQTETDTATQTRSPSLSGTTLTGVGTSGRNTSRTIGEAATGSGATGTGTGAPSLSVSAYGTGHPGLNSTSTATAGPVTITQSVESAFTFQYPSSPFVVVTISEGPNSETVSTITINATAAATEILTLNSTSQPIFSLPTVVPDLPSPAGISPFTLASPLASNSSSPFTASNSTSSTGLLTPTNPALPTPSRGSPAGTAPTNTTCTSSTGSSTAVPYTPPGSPAGFTTLFGSATDFPTLFGSATDFSTLSGSTGGPSTIPGVSVTTPSTIPMSTLFGTPESSSSTVTSTTLNSPIAGATLSSAPVYATESPSSFSTTTSSYANTAAVVTSSSARSAVTNATATSTSSGTAATPVVCGESGNFTLTWDDEPIFNPSSQTDFRFPPVFNPYHHMFFSNGYAYVQSTQEPFRPESEPHLAIFLPNLTNSDVGSPNAAGVFPGEIGAGPRASIDAFWIDAFSAYMGCDNEGPGDCTVTISGYKFDDAMEVEVAAVRQNATLPACPGFMNCELSPVEFTDEFRGLSGIQFEAYVNGSVPRIFLLDNLSMGWANNSCAAGLLRQRSRK